MKMECSRLFLGGVLTGSALALIGCAHSPTYDDTAPPLTAAVSADCTACGTITAIDRAGSAYLVTVRLNSEVRENMIQSGPFKVGDRVQILQQPVE